MPENLETVVTLGFVGENGDVADIGYTQSDGWSCSIPAFDGISSVRPGTFCCVFSLETYNNTAGSIESNIDFVGYLGDESTVTRGDEQYGIVSETRFTVNGFGTMMNITPIATIAPIQATSPVAWNQIKNPTPVRVLVYLLSLIHI